MPDIFVSNNNSPTPPSVAQDKTEKIIIDPPKTGKGVRLLTSFCENPRDIVYNELSENDTIFLFLRRHLVTNVPWIIEAILALLIPPIIGIILAQFNLSLSEIPSNLVFFSTLFYYFLIFEFMFLNFLNWFYNISLVSKEKVIDIDFKILFSKNVASTKISQIEDVSLNQIGLIRAVFDYGDVIVQTAGTEDNFDFEAIPHPERVVHIIGDLIGERQHV